MIYPAPVHPISAEVRVPTPILDLSLPRPDEQKKPRPSEKPAGRRGRNLDAVTAAAFLTPGMLAFALFVILPAVGGLVLTFFQWDLFGTPKWVGLANVSRLFGDADMWHALGVTALFVLMGVVPTILIGFVLAVLVNTKMPGVGVVRVFYFAPMIASAAVSALIWVNLYNSTGLVNQVLAWAGISGPNWLSDLTWARPALVVMMIWSGLPLVIILYLAGLQRVSEDIYAAAALDGASKWRQIWSMTWPNVWGTTLLIAVLETVGFVSGSFEVALIMTDGGPLGTTQSLALYAYKVAFSERDIGYASALSLFQLVLMMAVVLLVRVIVRFRKERS
ncbi:ABC-type sugar transport system permease subunit [Kribbella aluminosa]|uniref:ABC-type sugar transport system permease subunit n=1 Tax=Kribbella aluminosa TaxID=416017 RepID=A0ABS4UWA8_9ACTN|nr:sugar ABC transporter permease [Kribbella aluminosa]MBP2355927.1 ABC-type sugar transport system permease subunit [Kribbella aluminosa]